MNRMSTPSTMLRLSGDASTSGRWAVIGRRLANSSSSLRIRNRPASGRVFARGSSHFGPPTAPSKIACAERHSASVALGQRIAELIDRAAADRTGHKVEIVMKSLGHGPQHAFGLSHDLRPDAIAGEQNNLGVH